MTQEELEQALQQSEAARMRELERAASSRDSIVRLRERLRAKITDAAKLQEQLDAMKQQSDERDAYWQAYLAGMNHVLRFMVGTDV